VIQGKPGTPGLSGADSLSWLIERMLQFAIDAAQQAVQSK